MNDLVETNNFKNEMSLTGGDIERVVNHLEQVKQAVSKVMKEGIDNDFAIIPGTGKKSLLKPGAEKLLRLFGLGIRFNPIENIFDIVENFAMYSYAAEVYHLKTGTVLAQCEGTANSQEKKYKERSVYSYQGNKRTYSGKESIPVADIVNTLKKMAQKRAMVGATIIAVGASDYFSQDEEEIQNQQAVKRQPEKNDASRFGEGPQDYSNSIIRIGNNKGKKFSEVDKKDIQNTLDWTVKNIATPNTLVSKFIDEAREYLR